MANRATEIRRTTVSGLGAGTYNLVAGEAGYDIVVVAMALSADAAVQITLQDTVASRMTLQLGQDVPLVFPQLDPGWIRLSTGASLQLVVLAAVNVYGNLIYRLVPTGMEF